MPVYLVCHALCLRRGSQTKALALRFVGNWLVICLPIHLSGVDE